MPTYTTKSGDDVPAIAFSRSGESGSSRRDLPILEFVRHHCYIAVVTSTPAAYYTDLPIPIVFSLHTRIVSYMFANCDREGDDANSFLN